MSDYSEPKHPLVDDTSERALRRMMDSVDEPLDDGFCDQVLAKLPLRSKAVHTRWIGWVFAAQWVAGSIVAGAVAALIYQAQTQAQTQSSLESYQLMTALATLVCLLSFWFIPSRLSQPR
jgi:hypothetical protein